MQIVNLGVDNGANNEYERQWLLMNALNYLIVQLFDLFEVFSLFSTELTACQIIAETEGQFDFSKKHIYARNSFTSNDLE